MKTGGFVLPKVGDTGGKLDLFISDSVQSRFTCKENNKEQITQTTLKSSLLESSRPFKFFKEKYEHKI